MKENEEQFDDITTEEFDEEIIEEPKKTPTKESLYKKKYEAKEDLRKHSSMHIAALVLGIISVLTTFFWYLALPCGILAIVFGAKSARTLASKLGKAGMILGIIGVSLTVLIYISLILISAENFYYYY